MLITNLCCGARTEVPQTDLTKRAGQLKRGEFFRDANGRLGETIAVFDRHRERVSIEACEFTYRECGHFKIGCMPLSYLVQPIPDGSISWLLSLNELDRA